MNKKPILLVDDNQDDTLITKKVLKKIGVENKLVIARSGEEALELLMGNYQKEPQNFSLVLLDLRMSGMTGKQLLKELYSKKYTSSPIIIMSSSKEDGDVSECYAMNANCYIKKPIEYKVFVKVMEDTMSYWLKLNRNI